MNTNNSNPYTLAPNSYASFDATAIRDLIVKRLNDSGIFTDQNYVGSNLSSIIDIISFSFNALIYYLNKTSTESMFTEAQLYENMNRIVKLLDYNPVGFQTSTLACEFSQTGTGLAPGVYTIPRYSYITSGNISFSFNNEVNIKINNDNTLDIVSNLDNSVLLYQGIYQESSVYTALGDPNEVYTTNFGSALIDHFNMDVYVYEQDQQSWFQYKEVRNLYGEYAYSRVYEKRINQNGDYEFVFGDGINGRRLAQNEQIIVYTLRSLGDNGVVGPNALGKSNPNFAIYNSVNYNQILQNVSLGEQYNFITNETFNYYIGVNNTAGSTYPVAAESVDSIRANAPKIFRSQYRLVTLEDYQTFVLNNFANFVSDVKVFSNWDYTSRYLKYFNDIQVASDKFRQIVLNTVQYSDACNFNNIYICAKPKVSSLTSLKYLLPAQKELILSDAEPIKTLTSQITFVDPIYKAVSLGLPNADGGIFSTDTIFAQLQLVKAINTTRLDKNILADAVNIFQTFFNPQNIKIGQLLDYADLVSQLNGINGVQKLRTVRTDDGVSYNGLSLFVWNPNYPDLDIINAKSQYPTGEFEVFYFDNLANISNNIVVTTS